jgi:hypothetical protein
MRFFMTDRLYSVHNGEAAHLQSPNRGGQVMMPADLKRLHKYLVELEGIEAISDEIVESEWPEL